MPKLVLPQRFWTHSTRRTFRCETSLLSSTQESFLARSQEYEAALSRERERSAVLEGEKSTLEGSLQQTVSEAEVMKGALTTELEATRSRLQQTQVRIQHVRVCGGEGGE